MWIHEHEVLDSLRNLSLYWHVNTWSCPWSSSIHLIFRVSLHCNRIFDPKFEYPTVLFTHNNSLTIYGCYITIHTCGSDAIKVSLIKLCSPMTNISVFQLSITRSDLLSGNLQVFTSNFFFVASIHLSMNYT